MGKYNSSGEEIDLFLTTSDNDYVGSGVFSMAISPGLRIYENDYILGASKKRRFAYMETSETNGIVGGSVFSAGTMHVSGGVIWGQTFTGSVHKYRSKTIYSNEVERSIWFGLFWVRQLQLMYLSP